MSEPLFSKDCPVAAALLAWWKGLENHRGERAELRRAENLLAVMQLPAFHIALARLQAAGLSDARQLHQGERLAAIIGLAAHLRGTGEGAVSLPQAASEGEQPAVSPLRFRQVLEAQDPETLYTRLRRLLPLVEGRVHLGRLAADVYFWGDATRKRWVYDYRWPTKTA